MKKLITNIRYFFEYLIIMMFYWPLRLMPHWVVRLKATILGYIIFSIPYLRHEVMANLAIALPEKNRDEHIKIARRSCCHNALNMLEFIWCCGNQRRIKKYYTLSNEAETLLTDAIKNREQVIFVTPHLGCWEAAGIIAASYMQTTMAAIAKPLRNNLLNNFLNKRLRGSSCYMKIIFARGAIKSATRALKDGYNIGTLIDQNTRVRDGGIFINFFGLQVPSSKAPASLMHYCKAKNLNAKIIYGCAIRMPDGKVRCFGELLPQPFESYQKDDDVIQDLMNITERYIMQYPDQYVWLYHRFRYIPKDCPEDISAKYPYYSRKVDDAFYSSAKKNKCGSE